MRGAKKGGAKKGGEKEGWREGRVAPIAPLSGSRSDTQPPLRIRRIIPIEIPQNAGLTPQSSHTHPTSNTTPPTP